MKKKLTSVLALSMAMALTFGMTVFAEESPSTTNTSASVTTETVAADLTAPDASVTESLSKLADELSTGVTVSVSGSAVKVKETKAVDVAVMNNVFSVADTFARKTVSAAAGKTVAATLKAAVDVVVEGTIPAEGVTLTISVPGFVRDAAKNYIVLHLNEATGVWETIDATVADGQITATFKSLSPIVLVEVEQKAASASNAAAASTENSPAESPKTGETLPVAGILAVICLASAAVCAKKVRYNR